MNNLNKDLFPFHNDLLDNPLDKNKNISMILFLYMNLHFDKDLFYTNPSVLNMLDLEIHLNKDKYNFDRLVLIYIVLKVLDMDNLNKDPTLIHN
jgi:hypothetical protein